MGTDIGQWLESIGLGDYTALFVESAIDLSVLPHITDDELKELGVPLGARRRIQIHLADASGTSEAPAPVEPAAADAERRQVTVMFCDLVGSTALSSELDPEDYRDLLRSYQDACSGQVARYDGYVAQFLGDGVLAYFGWPRAHEDDVPRAIHAGLDIIRTVAALDASKPLSVRVGIATGPVVIGDLIGAESAHQVAVTGETPNRAARVQGLAGSNAIAVDEETHWLAGGLFEFDALGAQELKGIEGRSEVWRVLGERRVESRFAAASGEDLTPLVGRDEELRLLARRWKSAKSGAGNVVLVSGEPGIGKSRLARAMEESIVGEAHTRLVLQCSARHENSAFHPVIRQIEFDAGITSDDDDPARLDKLEALLARAGPPSGERVALFADLLSVTDDRHPLPPVPPPLKKQRILGALVGQVAALSAQAPVLIVIEDVHWIDPTSKELLELLIHQIRDLPVLMVITYRPEFTPPWVGADHVSLIALNRLGLEARALMAAQLVGPIDLSESAVHQLVERSDGVPLFIEELARAAQDAVSAGSVADSAIVPATLRDALESRLDRSGEMREVAQVGAAIGREFGYGMVSRLVSQPDDVLDGALADLVDDGLLFVRGTAPDARYTFKHALIQDTAYDTLLKSTRAGLHARIAETLLDAPPEGEEAGPEDIAHHFTEAGDAARAIPLWQQAGQAASMQSACVEAIAHLGRALDLLKTLPESTRRDDIELGLLMSLSPSMIWVKGMASEDVRALNERAFELAQSLGNHEVLFRILWAMWNHAIQHPPMARAGGLAAQLESTADETGSVEHRLQAHHARWTLCFMLGELEAAHHHATEGSNLYDVEAHGHHTQTYGGHDPGCCALSFDCLVLWVLGRPDEAVRTYERAFDLAARVGHQVSTELARGWAAMVRFLRGDLDGAAADARHCLEVCQRLGLVFAESYAQAVAVVEASRRPGEPVDPEVLVLIQEQSPAGMEVIRLFLLAELVGLQLQAGCGDDAMSLLEHAFETLEPYESHWTTAELLRRRGEVLLGVEDDEAGAEQCFQESLEMARSQSARAWELRTAMSIARLRREQGRASEGRAVLASVYDDFTEGLDTKDLVEAKALLDDLA